MATYNYWVSQIVVLIRKKTWSNHGVLVVSPLYSMFKSWCKDSKPTRLYMLLIRIGLIL